jgi:hypothetical protein
MIGCDTVYAGLQVPVSHTALLPPAWNMKPTCFSEPVVPIYQTTQSHVSTSCNTVVLVGSGSLSLTTQKIRKWTPNLSTLRSLWITGGCWLCMWWIALQVCQKILHITSAGRGELRFVKTSTRLPPGNIVRYMYTYVLYDNYKTFRYYNK